MSRPLIFFVHIGKAAGSTLNSQLQEHVGRGYPHCEHFIDNPDLWKQRVETADWLSGHVYLPKARMRLQGTGREVRYYTCIREPKAQIMSHYNWIAEIFHKGPHFYGNHPEPIKAISERVRATVADPSPEKVVRDLRDFGGLFLNNQSKYFVGHDLGGFESRLEASLPSFSAVCTSRSMQRLIGHLSGGDVAWDDKFENASRYHFDKALFDSAAVERFIEENNDKDVLMYDSITRRMTDGLLLHVTDDAAMESRPDVA
jgi:hypothetical protein